MTIHYQCAKIFQDLVNAILVRGQMDESAFEVMRRTGRNWEHIRKSMDYAMSTQNKVVQGLMRKLIECETPIYKELEKRG